MSTSGSTSLGPWPSTSFNIAEMALTTFCGESYRDIAPPNSRPIWMTASKDSRPVSVSSSDDIPAIWRSASAIAVTMKSPTVPLPLSASSFNAISAAACASSKSCGKPSSNCWLARSSEAPPSPSSPSSSSCGSVSSPLAQALACSSSSYVWVTPSKFLPLHRPASVFQVSPFSCPLGRPAADSPGPLGGLGSASGLAGDGDLAGDGGLAGLGSAGGLGSAASLRRGTSTPRSPGFSFAAAAIRAFSNASFNTVFCGSPFNSGVRCP